MNFQTDAPIIQKLYDFYRILYLAVGKMPKRDKYTLGEKLLRTNLDLLEFLIGASYFPRQEKINLLNQASIKLDLLKILLRLADELKSIPTKKYLILEEYLQETGKMLGGWIRSLK